MDKLGFSSGLHHMKGNFINLAETKMLFPYLACYLCDSCLQKCQDANRENTFISKGFNAVAYTSMVSCVCALFQIARAVLVFVLKEIK